MLLFETEIKNEEVVVTFPGSRIGWREVIGLMVISSGRPRAVAWVRGVHGLRGSVTFYSVPGGTLVTAEIEGLPKNGDGFFGFHIHEGNSCGGEEFSEIGGHWNPQDQKHPRHGGDLPPLLESGGRAFLAVKTGRFRPEEVIGRTVVIHGGPDDFRSQPGGDAGEKIGCGVIRQI